MLSDPMTLPASFPLGTSLPAVSRETNKSVYRTMSGTKTVEVTISTQQSKARQRTMVRCDASDIASDPLIPSNSRTRGVSAYVVFDFEPGFSPTSDVVNVAKELFGALGLVTAYTDLKDTILNRIVAGES